MEELPQCWLFFAIEAHSGPSCQSTDVILVIISHDLICYGCQCEGQSQMEQPYKKIIEPKRIKLDMSGMSQDLPQSQHWLGFLRLSRMTDSDLKTQM